jgi:hypothetical protein
LHDLAGRVTVVFKCLHIQVDKELENSLTDAGFKIDCHWQPGKGKAVYIVAKKAEQDQFVSDVI